MSFTVATDETGPDAPALTWSNDSFFVQFDGVDWSQNQVQISIKGLLNAWGDTLLGTAVSYTRLSDTCEASMVVPTTSFSYTLKNIRLNDYNTTFKRVQYRIAGEAITTHVISPAMTSVTCTGTSTYVLTLWSEGVGTTDIEIDFEWK